MTVLHATATAVPRQVPPDMGRPGLDAARAGLPPLAGSRMIQDDLRTLFDAYTPDLVRARQHRR